MGGGESHVTAPEFPAGGSYQPTGLPYIAPSEDIFNQKTPGGIVLPFIATAALNVGDPVFTTAAADNEVSKSATAADYQAGVGIVVGGAQTDYAAMQEDGIIGEPAAEAGELVFVMVLGKAKAVAQAAIAAGAKVGQSSVSGEVIGAAAAGQRIGTALTAATLEGDIITVLVHPH